MKWRIAVLLACVVSLTPALADVKITVESETLDTVLEELTATSTQVRLGEMQVAIVAEEIAIERLVPRSASEEGYVQLKLRLSAPDLGMRVPLSPKLYFEVVEGADSPLLELDFREVKIALPMGAIDVSSLMPTMRYPAETLFRLDGADGAVDLVATMSDVFVAPEGLQIVLDVGAR